MGWTDYDKVDLFNGEIIKVQLEPDKERRGHLRFTYKGINVCEYYDMQEYFFDTETRKICKIIDELGKDGYTQYKDYQTQLNKILEKNYLINNTIYSHKEYVEREEKYYHPIKSYSFEIRLTNEKFIHRQKTRMYDEYVTPSYLKDIIEVKRELERYAKSGVLPKDKYINKNLTDKYAEIMNWFEELKIEPRYN